MLSIITEIVVQTNDRTEQGIDAKAWYNVIGTVSREYTKDAKTELQDLIIIVNGEGKPVNVFLSKCKIRRADKKALSGFDAQDFIK